MAAGTAVVSSIQGGADAELARAYSALFGESTRSRRASRSALEVGLRCSNLAVWMYAGAQLLHSMS